ncbi:MAG: hypothetical protein EOL89_11915 [Actinobacteria bacterium]|nr:hypothetical protein [Actinomycetota bacterium]
MSTTLKRAFLAGAVAVAIGVPVGAYAVTGPMEEDEPETTESETWTPPRQQNQDCDAPDYVKEAIEEAGVDQLEADHKAAMTQLREEWRANPDPDGREAYRAEMTALRAQHRERVLAAVGDVSEDAAEWLADHWAEMTGPGFGQGGNGQGNGYGKANGPRNGDGNRAGGFRNGDGVGVQEQLRDPATD